MLSLNFTSCSIISPENASSVSGYKDDIPKVVKLHGDFRYDPLQNTGEELQKLEENLQEYIVKGSEERGLIIVAYSGSDQSIMETLQKVIKNPFAFPKGLIWCIPKGIKPSEELIQLIDEANKQNERSGFIEIDSFDFFLHKLYKVCDLQNEQIDSISKERFELRQAFRISQTTSQTTPILLNGIKACSFPKTIYSATTDLEGWSELRRLLQEKRIVGALYKGQTLLWGNEDDINNTFKGRIKDELKVVDIPEKFFYYSDSIYLGLLYDLVEKTFVEDYSLKIFARGKSIRKIFSNKHSLSNDEISNIKKWDRTFFVPSDIRIYEAFEFKIELINKSLFFLICPTIHIEKQDGKEAERRQNQYLSNIILSNRYNNLYSGKLSFWLKILKEINKNLTFKLDAFEIKLGTYYSIAAHQEIQNIFNFDGSLRLEEPSIYFHHKDESQKNINPINGLRIFGPIEESYGKLNGLQKVNLAILCSDLGFEHVRSHLDNLKNTISPKSEKEYLKEYPGFEEIYKKRVKPFFMEKNCD